MAALHKRKHQEAKAGQGEQENAEGIVRDETLSEGEQERPLSKNDMQDHDFWSDVL